MNQARVQVAGVAKIYRRKLFAALVEGEKLEIGGGVVQPGHTLGSRPPSSGRHHDLEPAKVPTAIAVLATMIQPENSQRQNSVNDGTGLGLADAAEPFSRRPRT